MNQILKEMHSSPDGDTSSKRVWASILFCTGILYLFLTLLINKEPSANVLYVVFGTAGLLLGVGAVTKT